ncbi:MAG TPA: hypothetical protein PK959_15825 [Candidatus Competibacteraceae bacterium]|nr:hypothetical protein [Candidatus Competibacteraceae bacterium]
MTDLEKFKSMLIDFEQQFEECQKNYTGRWACNEVVNQETWIAITLDIGHGCAVDFEFECDGRYRNCELYI